MLPTPLCNGRLFAKETTHVSRARRLPLLVTLSKVSLQTLHTESVQPSNQAG